MPKFSHLRPKFIDFGPNFTIFNKIQQNFHKNSRFQNKNSNFDPNPALFIQNKIIFEENSTKFDRSSALFDQIGSNWTIFTKNLRFEIQSGNFGLDKPTSSLGFLRKLNFPIWIRIFVKLRFKMSFWVDDYESIYELTSFQLEHLHYNLVYVHLQPTLVSLKYILFRNKKTTKNYYYQVKIKK